MKKTLYSVGLAAALIPCAAQAAPTYLIDSAASYVDALVPVWTSQPSYFVGISDPTQPLPPPTFDWALSWTTQRFSLSGSFTLGEEVSPFVPMVSHLNLSNVAVQTNTPAYTGFFLPSFVTRTGVAVERSEWVGWSDPFYGNSFICGCMMLGPWFEYQGSFDGTTFDLVGSQVNVSTPMMSMFLGIPEQPQLTDADLAASAGIFSFSLRASAAAPEPAPLALIIIGLAGLAALRRSSRDAYGAN
ncbi:MAG: PEP-CTERM sorting domain-containing protein [Gallionella sp.]|nr:MAG: PEP-CTERM sorting domain-containing protein [Gallionella sp.]